MSNTYSGLNINDVGIGIQPSISNQNINDIEKANILDENQNDVSNNVSNTNKLTNFEIFLLNFGCNSIFILLILYLSFIIFIFFDFYYANDTKSCQFETTSKMKLNLSQWLTVSGIIEIIVMIILTNIILKAFHLIVENENKNENKNVMIDCHIYCSIFLLVIIGLFNICWTIVGSVLFWRDILPEGHCKQDFADFVSAKLIISIVGFAINLFNK